MPDRAGPGRPPPFSRNPNPAADAIRALLNHVDELDTADLPVVEGRAVRIVALSEVEAWIKGCERRVREGVPL